MTEATEQPEQQIYNGRIFDGKISMLAWSIANRLEPNKEKSEERLGLAIAAQIGINHDMKPIDPNASYRRKLNQIQAILDGNES